MRHSHPIDQLIDTLYESAVSAADDCAWCDLLPGFCRAFDAAAGGLIAHDFVSGTATLRHSYRMDGQLSRRHDGGPWERRLPTRHGLSGYREGAVFSGEEIPSKDDLVRSDPQAYQLSYQLSYQLCGMITRDDGKGYLISLARPAEAEPFDGDDRQVLRRVLPHLKRSLQLHDEVAHRRFERESLIDFMDQLPVALLLVSRSGLVRLHNQAARQLLASRDAICLRSGYLAGTTARATAELRRLVSNAAAWPPGCDEATSAEHLVIARGPDRLPLITVAYPGRVADADLDGGAEPMVVVLIKDPQVDRAQSIADFIEAYHITKAEARLLRLLSDGHGLFEAAKKLGITRNTARTHMRSIYAKVGTHRQSDLVRLLYRFNIF